LSYVEEALTRIDGSSGGREHRDRHDQLCSPDVTQRLDEIIWIIAPPIPVVRSTPRFRVVVRKEGVADLMRS